MFGFGYIDLSIDPRSRHRSINLGLLSKHTTADDCHRCTADDCRRQRQRPGDPVGGRQQWSKLPDKLLGAIYLRLYIPLDRVRFAAVCTRWFFAAAWHRRALPFLHAADGKGRTQGTPSAAVRQWCKLPDDLLCAIYLRLDADLDRDRFDAVCTSWRATASHPQRRVVPWLILDPCGGYDEAKQYVYCPQDRAVLPRLPFLDEAIAGGCFVGGHEGGWIACSQAPFRIINLFSGAEVRLSGEHIVHRLGRTEVDALVFRKIIFSEQPTLSSCILAGITDKHELAYYTIGCPEAGWTVRAISYGDDALIDIAFCSGELYGITRSSKQLIKYEFCVDGRGTAPVIIQVHSLCMLNNYWENFYEHARYIFELRGKLLMVGSNHNWWSRCLRNACGPRFTVHELVDTGIEKDTHNMRKYRWEEVKSLGEHALFLGPTCSKAVRLPASGRGDVRRDHIYFSHHRCLMRNYEVPNGAKVLFTSSNGGGDPVYYKVDESDSGGVEGIMSVGYYVLGGARPPIWLFPPDM